jgi:DNA-binding transcriptional LysR family regulator
MDLIAALRSFLRVAEVGSFSVVGRSAPSRSHVSRQVSALEEHFRTRLVQRSTRVVTLTEEGRDLMPGGPAAYRFSGRAAAIDGAAARQGGRSRGVRVPVPLGLYFCSERRPARTARRSAADD